jgi:hypothetical protein
MLHRLKQVVPSKLLSHAQHFIRRRHALTDLQPPILTKIAHPVAASGGRNLARVFVPHDDSPELFVQFHQFKNSHAPTIAGVEAPLATATAKTWNTLAARPNCDRARLLAIGADHTDQSMRQNGHNRRREKVIKNTKN